MTKAKDLSLPLIVILLVLAALVGNALTAEDALVLPLPNPPKEHKAFPPTPEATIVKSPVAEAANQLAVDDAALANAETEEARTAEALKAVTSEHDKAIAAVETAKSNRAATYKRIGELLAPPVKESPKIEAPKPEAPKLPAIIEAPKPAAKCSLLFFHTHSCQNCPAQAAIVKQLVDAGYAARDSFIDACQIINGEWNFSIDGQNYRVSSVPTTVILGADGKEKLRHAGYVASLETLESELKAP